MGQTVECGNVDPQCKCDGRAWDVIWSSKCQTPACFLLTNRFSPLTLQRAGCVSIRFFGFSGAFSAPLWGFYLIAVLRFNSNREITSTLGAQHIRTHIMVWQAIHISGVPLMFGQKLSTFVELSNSNVFLFFSSLHAIRSRKVEIGCRKKEVGRRKEEGGNIAPPYISKRGIYKIFVASHAGYHPLRHVCKAGITRSG